MGTALTDPTDITLTPPDDRTSKVPNETSEVELGMWFWVKSTKGHPPEEYEWLGCVIEIGSNYVKLQSPDRPGYGTSYTRVHFDNFWTRLRFEPDADAVIRRNIAHYQTKTAGLMEEVRGLTARLGVSPQAAIGRGGAQAAAESNAIAVITSQPDIHGFKAELILAKEETLPNLFKEMEESNKELARWMSAPALPMLAQIGPMKEVIEKINGSIFNISLYAGLTEDAYPVAEGEAAAFPEKLHVMQRRLYMDEECLLNYTAGGMTIREIEEFDAWLAKPENRDRILPFPRTAVAFRVRRFERETDGGVGLLQAFIDIQLREADKLTFLYIRNGEQIWRIATEMDFGPKLFPDAGSLDSAEMMVHMWGDRVKEFITKADYDERLAAHEKAKADWEAKDAAWRAENPNGNSFTAPHGHFHSSFTPRDWQPFDPTSVYYDDASKEINQQITAYNRVGLIIQGLFDRSPVLHPHAPVQTWTPEGFARALELVYDGSGSALYASAEAPDFETYRAKLNAKITADSILTGQEEVWMRVEADKENRRIDASGRRSGRYQRYYRRFRPYGNPGPGVVAPMHEWKPRARQAVFRWLVQSENAWKGVPDQPRTIAVPVSKLLNVSAYTPGDYKQFFRDPRTREDYIKWAPMMLAAEDYHAGKINPNKASTD